MVAPDKFHIFAVDAWVESSLIERAQTRAQVGLGVMSPELSDLTSRYIADETEAFALPINGASEYILGRSQVTSQFSVTGRVSHPLQRRLSLSGRIITPDSTERRIVELADRLGHVSQRRDIGANHYKAAIIGAPALAFLIEQLVSIRRPTLSGKVTAELLQRASEAVKS